MNDNIQRKPEHVQLARKILEFEHQDSLAVIGELLAQLENVFVVFDRSSPNNSLPFVSICNTRKQAQELVDRLNINGPVRGNSMAWYEPYDINDVHRRAIFPEKKK